mmetsp:Transcript_33490/g.73777  ORF Transcript_33490/g.73777 Transcript_33490/m.73777 type:complete len:273 (+) Transcript_33490:788-1606(+)
MPRAPTASKALDFTACICHPSSGPRIPPAPIPTLAGLAWKVVDAMKCLGSSPGAAEGTAVTRSAGSGAGPLPSSSKVVSKIRSAAEHTLNAGCRWKKAATAISCSICPDRQKSGALSTCSLARMPNFELRAWCSSAQYSSRCSARRAAVQSLNSRPTPVGPPENTAVITGTGSDDSSRALGSIAASKPGGRGSSGMDMDSCCTTCCVWASTTASYHARHQVGFCSRAVARLSTSAHVKATRTPSRPACLEAVATLELVLARVELNTSLISVR